MTVSIILTAIVALAWVLAAILPSLLAPGVTRAVGALHHTLDRGDSAISRVAPLGWIARIFDTPLIAALAVLLIADAWLFFGLLEDVSEGEWIVDLDRRLFHFLQEQRTLLLDRLMITVTGLGDQKVVMPVALAGLLALVGLQRWRAAAYLLMATAGAAVFVGGIKRFIHRPRPISIYDGMAEYSFPSGHACMSVVLYGILAFLLAYGAPAAWRRGIAFWALVLVGLISFSRVYLGAHWLSDVIAGLAFGSAWLAFLTIAYLRGQPGAVPLKAFGAAILAALVIAGSVHAARDFGAERGRYTIQNHGLPKQP